MEENGAPNVFPNIRQPAIKALCGQVITIPALSIGCNNVGYIGHGQPTIRPKEMHDKEAEINRDINELLMIIEE